MHEIMSLCHEYTHRDTHSQYFRSKLVSDPDYSMKAVAARLVEVWGEDGDREVARVLKRGAGWRGSYEKVRRARNAIGKGVTHDLVAATAIVYGVDAEWILTGRGKAKPADAGWRVSLSEIGHPERVALMGMLGEVQQAIAEGSARINSEALRGHRVVVRGKELLGKHPRHPPLLPSGEATPEPSKEEDEPPSPEPESPGE